MPSTCLLIGISPLLFFGAYDYGNSSIRIGGCFPKFANGLNVRFTTISKGQIKSECIYEIINLPKYHQKNLIDFCPGRFYSLGTCDLFWLFSRRLYSSECIAYLVWITFQGRNLSNILCGILENRWFHIYILTSSEFWTMAENQIPIPNSNDQYLKVR